MTNLAGFCLTKHPYFLLWMAFVDIPTFLSMLSHTHSHECTLPQSYPAVLANDTLLGSDQLFAVPINLPQDELGILPRDGREGIPSLCFEIHGDADTHFNLISDTCTSVNALYSNEEPPNGFHTITKIGISAIDNDERSIFIEVGTGNGCTPIVRVDGSDGVEVVQYFSEGVSVTRRRNRVRVSVPNCEDIQLVMSVLCENRTSDGVPTMRFDVTRGVNLSPTSHGLLGRYFRANYCSVCVWEGVYRGRVLDLLTLSVVQSLRK